MSEREHDGEDRVEDLDVPESEGEDVKGGALNAYDKASPSGFQVGTKYDPAATKISPEGLNLSKWG